MGIAELQIPGFIIIFTIYLPCLNKIYEICCKSIDLRCGTPRRRRCKLESGSTKGVGVAQAML